MNSTHTQLHGRTVGSDDRRRWIKRKPANEIDEQRHEPAHQGRPHVRAVDSAGIVVRFVQQRDSLAQRNTRGGHSITQESTSIDYEIYRNMNTHICTVCVSGGWCRMLVSNVSPPLGDSSKKLENSTCFTCRTAREDFVRGQRYAVGSLNGEVREGGETKSWKKKKL